MKQREFALVGAAADRMVLVSSPPVTGRARVPSSPSTFSRLRLNSARTSASVVRSRPGTEERSQYF